MNNEPKTLHLMITPLCNRNCKYCCNKQYSLSDIPVVTDKELKETEILCLTGGEPFAFTDPCAIAQYYKRKYSNIKSVFVYTNAMELAKYLLSRRGSSIHHIDGLSISLKNTDDVSLFNTMIKNNIEIFLLPSNRLYVFDNLYSESPTGFNVIKREWQEEFVSAKNSIFRRL